MSDLTVQAEALISTVARAFYEDEAVMLIDVLLRDKFLRDDDMSVRLSLPAKQLRQTLQFLQREHIVKYELVDDLATGGSQATKFWYIDYNHAVNAIRLRIYLLRTKLEKDELQARSNSYYMCPGFNAVPARCNGKYNETQAQSIVDISTGLFLCQECVETFENDPNAPPKSTYTLQLIDNKKDLKAAVDNMRRVNVQLSSKTIGSNRIRESIFDLLQKVRGGRKNGPLSSNLPSENFSLGIGSKRIEGTGRTAGIKAKKRAQLGMNPEIKKSPVDDLTFLRNAIGQEVTFTVVKGSGARALLLATNQQRRQKLMDAAASRVGADLSVPVLVKKLKREKEELERQKKKHKADSTVHATTLDFLEDNIGLSKIEAEFEKERQRQIRLENERKKENGNDQQERGDVVVVDDDGLEDMLSLPDEDRRAKFQALYKSEMERQAKELNLDLNAPQLSSQGEGDFDENSVTWEDG